MALETSNLISTLLFELDRASYTRTKRAKDDLEGDIDVELDVDLDERGFNNKIGGFKKGLNGLSVLGVATGNVIASGFLAATQSIGGTIAESVRLAAEAEKTNIAFSTFLGSTEAARDVISDLQNFSLATPFSPESVISAGRSLLAFGEPVEGLVDTISRLGDISAGVNVPVENLAELYGKARIAGTIFSEDINQLTGLGVDVITEFSKQLNVSTSEVKALASEGKITFENLEAAVKSLTGEQGQFFQLTARQATSVAGLQSSLAGAAASLQTSLGEALLPLLRELLPRLISGLFSLVEAARNAAEPIASFFIGSFRVIESFLSPIVASVRDFFKQFDTGRGILNSLKPVLDLLARAFVVIGEQVGRVISVFTGFTSAIKEEIGGNSIIGRFVSFVGRAFSNLPAFVNGVAEAFFALPSAINNGLERTILNIRAFISDAGTLLNPANFITLIREGFDGLDFSNGDVFRRQAEQFNSFGSVVSDAFNEGFNKINDVEFELPDIVTPGGIEQANEEGEDLGNAVGEGIKKGLDKSLPAGSLASLKKALSEVEKELQLTANVAVFEGRGIDELREKIQEIAEKREEIELLERVIDRLSTTQVESIGFELETIGGVEGVDQELVDIFNKNRDSLEEAASKIDKVGLFGLTPEELEEVKSRAGEALNAAKELTQQLLTQQIARKDNEIAIQEERLKDLLAIADEGNAEQLQLEESRLRGLQEEREKAVRAQRQLAAAEIAINTAVAVSQGIAAITKAFAEGNAVLGVLTGIALAAQVAGAIVTLSSAFGDIPSFAVGTDFFDPQNPDSTGGAVATLHKGEGVIPEHINKKLRALGTGATDPNLPYYIGSGLGMYQNARIKPELMSTDTINTVKTQQRSVEQLKKQNAALTNQMKRVEKAIYAIGQEVNITEDGIYVATRNAAKKKERRKKLRR